MKKKVILSLTLVGVLGAGGAVAEQKSNRKPASACTEASLKKIEATLDRAGDPEVSKALGKNLQALKPELEECEGRFAEMVEPVQKKQAELAELILKNDLQTKEGKAEYKRIVKELRSEIEKTSGKRDARRTAKSYTRLAKRLEDVDFSKYTAEERERQKEVMSLYTDLKKREAILSSLIAAHASVEKLPKEQRASGKFQEFFASELRKSNPATFELAQKYAVKTSVRDRGRQIASGDYTRAAECCHVAIFGTCRGIDDPIGNPYTHYSESANFGPGAFYIKGRGISFCSGSDPGGSVGVVAGVGGIVGGVVGISFGGDGGVCFNIVGGQALGAFAGISSF